MGALQASSIGRRGAWAAICSDNRSLPRGHRIHGEQTTVAAVPAAGDITAARLEPVTAKEARTPPFDLLKNLQ